MTKRARNRILTCFFFRPRPNKDDGKKGEERTGIKKKGEYYSVNVKNCFVQEFKFKQIEGKTALI